MTNKSDVGLDRSSRGAAPSLWWLLPLGLVALIGVRFAPMIYWNQMEGRRLARLHEEARRFGGKATIPEGGWDFARRGITIHLDLTGTKVGDDDLARFVAMPAFKDVSYLILAGAPITDRGVSLLRTAPRLNALDLSRTKVTDDCFDALGAIPNLGNIVLSGTRVSDAGLATYGERTARYSATLDVTDTAVTEAGARKLFAKFNQWNIIYGPSSKRKIAGPGQ